MDIEEEVIVLVNDFSYGLGSIVFFFDLEYVKKVVV